jgi:hypothetical protein
MTNIAGMECNKEEAFRAKEIAEKKFIEKDISGAKRHALKAQKLYPGLDGLPQFLATLDVYISAEKRINGEIDWYGVLGVQPLADDDTIRKHYRKLALILHPDKNKSVGADGAFKILSEAWTFLSDKAKKNVYDQKRNFSGIYEKIPDRKSSAPTGPNGFHNLSNCNNFNTKYQKSATHPQPAGTPHLLKPTFWTVCNSCKIQFEYLRNYLNCNLVCSNCRKPFKALEMPPPPHLNGHVSSTSWNPYVQRQNSGPQTMDKNQYAPGKMPTSTKNALPAGFPAFVSSKKTFQTGAFFKSGGVASMPVPASPAAQATGVFQPASEQLKRGHEDAAAASVREALNWAKIHAAKKAAGLAAGSSNAGSSSAQKGDRPKKKRRMDEHNQMTKEKRVGMDSASGSQKVSFETGRMNASGKHRTNTTRELSHLEMRNMLMEKAKKEIRKKLNEWSTASVLKTSQKLKTSEKEVGEKNPAVNGLKSEKCREFVHTKNTVETEKSSHASSSVNSNTNGADPISMSVPDPDFHDFDKDRTEKSFGDNQVWAAYDDDDGMPRYYAMIHSVISRRPFKMRISWLNSKSNDELAPLNWIGSGFYKTSGDFWIGKYEVNASLNSFSHKVQWTKGARGSIQIYPMKGDVWALYRNWSPDWNALTPDEVIHKYDMVEVLEDYNEEQGVTVAPLVKFAGFKTVFHHNVDPKTRTIPRAEMFRFSHQVPSYLLTGQEAHNAPKGCWEIDPAATPLELLQVVTDAQKEGLADTSENYRQEEPLRCTKNCKEEELVENGKTNEGKDLEEDIRRKDVAEVTMKKEKEPKEEKMLVYNRRRLREGKMLESAN